MGAGSQSYDPSISEGSEPARIDLVHSGSFRLGSVLIEPSRRRLSRPGGAEAIVEPRVMQVLVTLFEAAGLVVGRDELIERCWSGRIVGENSINRVISLLRKTADTLGQGDFAVETIPKVGYRLVSAATSGAVEPEHRAMAAAASPSDGAEPWNRRRVLRGLATAAVTLGVPFGVATLREGELPIGARHTPTPDARELYDAGMRAQYFAVDATSEQAEIYFRRAAQADPAWADAWGSLAMSYRHMMDGQTNANQWRLVEQTRSAANRSLELDRQNAEALVALTLIASPYGRWDESEAEYAAMVERFPKAFVMRGHYGRLLRDLGRFEEATVQTARQVADHPLVPLSAMAHILSLWGAGRIHEADAEADRAFKLFAKHPAVWFIRIAYLTHTGREAQAVGMAMDREGWPAGLPPFLFERRRQTAQALLTRSPEDIAAARAGIDNFVQRSLAQPPHLIDPVWPGFFLSAIGDNDAVFDLLDNYYFGRGRLAPPIEPEPGPLTRRDSWFLFMPVLGGLRRDPRFSALVEEIGLTANFRKTGKWPDSWRPGT